MKEGDILQNIYAVYLNIFLHGINSISCFIDIFISGRPWRFSHFIFPIFFGLYYAFFSVIYWAAGGVGLCFTGDNIPEDATEQQGDYFCTPYIYPGILDWKNHPGIAIGVISGLCLAMPLFHSFWMIFSNLRQYFHVKFSNERQVMEPFKVEHTTKV